MSTYALCLCPFTLVSRSIACVHILCILQCQGASPCLGLLGYVHPSLCAEPRPCTVGSLPPHSRSLLCGPETLSFLLSITVQPSVQQSAKPYGHAHLPTRRGPDSSRCAGPGLKPGDALGDRWPFQSILSKDTSTCQCRLAGY